MAVKGKEKGGRYEREKAKDLSVWIFGEQHVLKRHPDSGASKQIWCGDIYPMQQIPDWHGQFPFMIECKNGYPKDTPTFWKMTRVKKWFEKAYLEGIEHDQEILWLIARFKYQPELFITNVPLPDMLFEVCFPVEIDKEIKYAYVYRYTDVLDKNFYDLYNLQELIHE